MHEDRVLALADRLRADGVDAIIDLYEPFPPQGWPAWCDAQISRSDFVLMACTGPYLRRVAGDEEPDVGRGVLWEARLIKQHLYNAGSAGRKFVPVLFADGSDTHVPVPVAGATIHRVDRPEGYEALLRLLTYQPLTPMPPLGLRRELPARQRQAAAERLAEGWSEQPQKQQRTPESEQSATKSRASADVINRGLSVWQRLRRNKKSIYGYITLVIFLLAAVGWVTLFRQQHPTSEAVTPTDVRSPRVSSGMERTKEKADLGRSDDLNSISFDRRFDILWQNDDGQVAIWKLNGTAIIFSSVLINPGPDWRAFGLGDYNGYGGSAIYLQNTNGELKVWKPNGINAIGSSSLGHPEPDWHVVGLRVFKGERASYLLLQNSSGEVAIWKLNGISIIATSVLANPGPDWRAFGLGDYNEDGNSAICFQNSNGEVKIWKLNGTNVIGSSSLGKPGPSWHAVSLGDLTDDSNFAIYFQNSNGEVTIKKLNGTNVIDSSSLGNPGASWHAIGSGNFSPSR